MQTYQYPEGGDRPDEGQRNNLLVTSGTICWCTSGRWVTTICFRRVTRISLISAGKCVRNCAHVPQIFYGVHNGGCKHTITPARLSRSVASMVGHSLSHLFSTATFWIKFDCLILSEKHIAALTILFALLGHSVARHSFNILGR